MHTQGEDTSAAENSDDFTAAFAPPEPNTGAEGGAEPSGDGANRDERGRFAPRQDAGADAAAPVDEPPPERTEPQDHRVPLRDLLDERERRQEAARRADELERRIAAFEAAQRQSQQQPQQRPDPISDPEAYARYLEEEVVGPRIRAIQQQFVDSRVDQTFEAAAAQVGKESFDKMVDAFVAVAGKGGANDPQLFRKITGSSNPGAALLRWHREHEIVSDPDGYVNRRLDERLKDPEVRRRILDEMTAEARSNGRPSNVSALPPSLNRAPGASGRAPAEGEDRDDFQAAFGSRRA